MESGYLMVDTASVYGNEENVGRAMKKAFEKKMSQTTGPLAGQTGNPYGVFISSKAGPSEMGGERTYQACLDSIKKLGVQKLDLYLLHWPGATATKPAELRSQRHKSWQAMERLYEEGRVRAIGVSNYLPTHVDQLIADGVKIMPMVNQFEMHPMCWDEEVLKHNASKNIQVEAYSSLGMGTNTLLDHPVVNEIASKLKVTPGHVLLRWGLQHGAIVIPRSKTPSRISANGWEALNAFEIPSADMKVLDALNGTEKHRFCWDPNTIV
eukprot:GHVT01009630.1.p1 GENE.GHVT01009630.1~~GHVT01009630.1.p1  ORF type:complete len:267 (+),score=24.63 GHVT01009630.1:473-1273(+)